MINNNYLDDACKIFWVCSFVVKNNLTANISSYQPNFFATYIYKSNVQMWKMWTNWMLCQCYFATFKQNSIRIIQKLHAFGCKSYFMCEL